MTKHSKRRWYAVQYGGYVNIQDRPEYIGAKNLLDAEDVGEEQALVNGRLATAAPLLLFYAKSVMESLEKYGADIVPHLIDSDANDGERLRQLIEELSK